MSATKMLTVLEAAELLGMKPERVRVWLREGRLTGSRLGGDRNGWKIPRVEVERMQRQVSLGGRVATSVFPIRAVTVYAADPEVVQLIECGSCSTILQRGEACAHLRFSARALVSGPQVSVELSANVDVRAPRQRQAASAQ